MTGPLDKLERTLFGREGRRKGVEDDPVQAWRARFGQDPPPAIWRLFKIPIRSGDSRQELEEAGVDLAEVLQAVAVAGGMVEPGEVALSAKRGSGDGHYPGDRSKHAVSAPSGSRLAEEEDDAPPDSPLRRRPRTL